MKEGKNAMDGKKRRNRREWEWFGVEVRGNGEEEGLPYGLRKKKRERDGENSVLGLS